MGVAALATVVVLVATRHDPVLSPDSITYLSAADHLRRLDGYADFTGEPLAHFPPVFPLLLSIGGTSLRWASVVGAVSAGAVAALFSRLVLARARWSVAAVGSIAFALSQALVRVESTVWSETPYLVAVLAVFVVLDTPELSIRRAFVAGGVAGLGFLTRYAGAGLVVTGVVMVIASTRSGGRDRVLGRTTAFVGASGGLAAAWMLRNVVATGEPLGPHFEGGAGDSLVSLTSQTSTAIGRLVIDFQRFDTTVETIGAFIAVAAIVGMVAVVVRSSDTVHVGMATFGLVSLGVPVLSRALTGTHIEARIMAPVLVPLVYFTVIGADRVVRGRRAGALALAAAMAWSAQGVIVARDIPDRLAGSVGDRTAISPQLYDLVAGLPEDAAVLTNSPQRVWWHGDHDPVHFAFTVPEPGNSHFPLTADEIEELVCMGETYLAWFPGLLNAGGDGPADVRPDLAARVELDLVADVDGGSLHRLAPAAATPCAD